MPCLEAPPIPPKKLRGTEITKAQGQEMTRKVNALKIHSVKGASLKVNGGIKASIAARITTAGV
ncbi:hypothetical protein SDC9_103055 [bioreactor metagenome]|uniref:Uncharacterized protein n=1 Tax=bioreactor metagenome TaxID=1076179 RepID=A0A645AZC7_9ZZZZ